jgi:hypothetical protein
MIKLSGRKRSNEQPTRSAALGWAVAQFGLPRSTAPSSAERLEIGEEPQ